MTTPPCGWPTGLCGDDLYGFSGDNAEENAYEVEQTAIYILWSLTGQKFGPCEVVATPAPSCDCATSCGCRGCEIALPGPVNAILEVLVNGEVYDDWAYVNGTLYSTKAWPSDVVVTYLKGMEVPPGADRAIKELARELAAATCKPDACRLPTNITSRTRAGDTVEFGDVPDGKTNIPLVDLWIMAVSQTTAQGSVWSPDMKPWTLDYIGGSL